MPPIGSAGDLTGTSYLSPRTFFLEHSYSVLTSRSDTVRALYHVCNPANEADEPMLMAALDELGMCLRI
jgi:hypothetical protein